MPETKHELQILEQIERDPDVTQAGLANQLGVAVGKINWYIKRLTQKGYVKVTHLQRRKLHYFLTPSGLARKVQLTHGYMVASLRVYRELRQSALQTLSEIRRAGYASVHIEDNDEAAEILHLTCLEQNVKAEKKSTHIPTLRVNGTNFVIDWPDDHKSDSGQKSKAPRR